ncbi:hypothetical protein EDB87DRAFT_1835868 [Lactarius vividus]|nr:hypothetical protein EDB87DRAFT_1835868 [Lactarius vividus]
MPIREHAKGTSGILRKVLMIIPCMNRKDVRTLRRLTKITQLDAHLVLGLKMVSMSKDQFKRFFRTGTTGDALPAFARYDASAFVFTSAIAPTFAPTVPVQRCQTNGRWYTRSLGIRTRIIIQMRARRESPPWDIKPSGKSVYYSQLIYVFVESVE